MFKRILIPTDGSDLSRQAIDTGVSLARAVGASLEFLSVKLPFIDAPIADGISMQSPLPQVFLDAQERLAAERVQTALATCESSGLGCSGYTIEAMHPWEAIVAHAQAQGCDLIVMGSHGRGSMSALLLGSQTQKVLTHTKVPVLVVR